MTFVESLAPVSTPAWWSVLIPREWYKLERGAEGTGSLAGSYTEGCGGGREFLNDARIRDNDMTPLSVYCLPASPPSGVSR